MNQVNVLNVRADWNLTFLSIIIVLPTEKVMRTFKIVRKVNNTHSLKFQEHTSECLVDTLLNSSYMTQKL